MSALLSHQKRYQTMSQDFSIAWASPNQSFWLRQWMALCLAYECLIFHHKSDYVSL